MLKSENNNFYNVLFGKNKLINYHTDIEKNNSEELLTIRAIVFITKPVQEMEEYVQLEKMLAACKLQQQDYKVVADPDHWTRYRNYDNIKEVLLLGIDEKDLNIGVNILENQINHFDGRVWIKSISIAQMANNQQAKNNLWQNALKPYFVGS